MYITIIKRTYRKSISCCYWVYWW